LERPRRSRISAFFWSVSRGDNEEEEEEDGKYPKEVALSMMVLLPKS
jgi:hypothetical protein